MTDAIQRVQSTRLFRVLREQIGHEEVREVQVVQLEALILAVAGFSAPHLARISRTFWQYTDHDLLHLCNVADLVYRFLPKREAAEGDRPAPVHLNAVEITFLWLGILLHDIGMYVPPEEQQELQDSEAYARHRRLHQDRVAAAEAARDAGREVVARAIEDALFADFIRRLHPARARTYVLDKLDPEVRLEFEGTSLARDVADLCESHAWGVRESNDPRRPEQAVARLERHLPVSRVRVHLQYVACCLRLGDILDFDRSRTPQSVFDDIGFTEPVSIDEWNKHLSIQGWEVTEHHVRFRAACERPVQYVAVHQFLDWVDDELRECRYLIDEAPAGDEQRYALHLSPIVDRRQVRMADPRYVAGGFRFALQYDQIMQLLMDRSLYPDPSLLLRELLQNALDACRYQQALAEDAGMGDKYVPRIVVHDLSQDPDDPRIVFEDNGTGMSMRQVERYFLRVGTSFYRSREFEAELERLQEKGIHLDRCSRFGIGFLSCFLGGDLVEVETRSQGSRPLHITIPGPSRYFVIERIEGAVEPIPFLSPEAAEVDGPPSHSGTRVTVHLDERWFLAKVPANIVRDTLRIYCVNAEVPVRLVGSTDRHGVIDPGGWSDVDCQVVSREGLLGKVEPHLQQVRYSLGDFDRHLRGSVSLPVLQDEAGRLTPRIGFLRVSSFHGAGGDRQQKVAVDDWLFSLTSLIIEQELSSFQLAQLLDGDVATTEASVVGEVRQAVQGLEAADRLALIDALRQLPSTRYSFQPWFVSGRWWRALASGSVAQLTEALIRDGVFDPSACALDGHSALALFGITVPAGIVSWSPEAGVSQRVRLAPKGIGLLVDAVGRLAPAPSASRLFIPVQDARELRVAVANAIIAAGVRATDENGATPEWLSWMESLRAACSEGDRSDVSHLIG